MKNFKMMLVVAGLMTLAPMVTASAAEATHYRRGIEARQRYQNARIEQGERTGTLSYRESERLERQEARIERQEERYQASGNRFTPRERARIQRELNTESRRIYREKHDHDRD